MNPITHFLAGWAVANAVDVERRDRALITLGGVLPDLDGLGVLAYLATAGSAEPSMLYHDYHHVLCHNVGAGLAFAALALCLARRRGLTALMVLVTFHLHLLGDVLGSRGPDGYQWPVPYLSPFTDSVQLAWSGQWELASWQNVAISMGLLFLCFWLGRRRGFTCLELVSSRADAAVVAALRARFPAARSSLAVTQGFDGVEVGGAPRGVDAGHEADG